MSIEEISLGVGYENQSYFFRQFKKRYGMIPRRYRIEKGQKVCKLLKNSERVGIRLIGLTEKACKLLGGIRKKFDIK